MVTIDGFVIDALISIDPQKRAETTKYPVERGARRTDHIVVEPETIMVQGLVSDTPLGLVKEARESSASLDDGTTVAASTEAYLFLSQMMDEGRLVTLVSGVFPPFRNVVLVGLSGPQTAETGASYAFQAEFQTTILVNVKAGGTLVAAPRAKKKKDRGNVTAPEVPEEQATKAKAEARNQSVLSKGLEGLADRAVGAGLF